MGCITPLCLRGTVLQNKRMKIAYIFQPPWNPKIMGALGIWNRQVTRRLANECNVIVYAAALPGQKEIECLDGVKYRCFSLRFDNWLLRYLDALSRRSLLRSPVFASSLYYIGFALQVANDLRRQKCDVVHIHTLSQFVPIIRALNPRIRIVLHMHGEWLTQLDRKMIEGRIGKADMIIACSEYVTARIRKCFPAYAQRAHTVFMGVDPEAFSPHLSEPPADRSSRKRLLFVGRISPEKGVHVLLEAFQKVAADYPEAHLDIVGPDWVMPPEYHLGFSDGSHLTSLMPFYSRDYRGILQELLPPQIARRVTFHGLVQHSELDRYYRDADLYISSSFYESLGMSILEAMASGLPVIGTRVGGVPEAVTHGATGILIEPGDAGQLSATIADLLSNQYLRNSLAKEARKRAIDLFSWDHVCDNLLRTYSRLCSGDGSPG